MRRQFETRGRLVIYMEQTDINRLTAQAKLQGRLLIPWVREALLELLANGEPPVEHGARTTLTALRSRKKIEVVEVPTGEPVHTANSNRLTCPCKTCVEYRRMHDLPLGGLPKKVKK